MSFRPIRLTRRWIWPKGRRRPAQPKPSLAEFRVSRLVLSHKPMSQAYRVSWLVNICLGENTTLQPSGRAISVTVWTLGQKQIFPFRYPHPAVSPAQQDINLPLQIPGKPETTE